MKDLYPIKVKVYPTCRPLWMVKTFLYYSYDINLHENQYHIWELIFSTKRCLKARIYWIKDLLDK